MGTMIGRLGPAATAGERRVHGYLKALVGGQAGATCYFEPLVGDARPDFLLLSPTTGVTIIEVKDYHEAHLQAVNASGEWVPGAMGISTPITSPCNVGLVSRKRGLK